MINIIKVIITVIVIFLAVSALSLNLKLDSEKSGFAEDPRDSSRKIFINSNGINYTYLEQIGTESQTGEILLGIQIINRDSPLNREGK